MICKNYSFVFLLLCGLSFSQARAENFKVMTLRGSVFVYFNNGHKEQGARGQRLETDQRWVVDKGGGLYLEGDQGSKISFIDSGVLFFRKHPEAEKGWQLEVSGRELYVFLSPKSDLSITAPRLKTEEVPVEFYYEDQGQETIIRVLQGKALVLDDEESIPMKTLLVTEDDIDIEPFDRSDFNRVQLRHENNSLGRNPDLKALKGHSPHVPWRLSAFGSSFWTHLLPEKSSSFAQDKWGFGGKFSFSKDFLLRSPPSPDSLPWMPRMRVGIYAQLLRPSLHLSPSGKFNPLTRDFGISAGLAWEGFFLMGQVGFPDFSTPFRIGRPFSTGAELGFEKNLVEKNVYKIFWTLGVFVHQVYLEIDNLEASTKGISPRKFRAITYGLMTGPSLAF